ncbi:MAG: diadenylate cyclase CdaA [Kiritimatiellae bacterium]|jgi:diadenylate cyclase|nr:diadenylate cyclase CdaA [Kiritimatiellia bacterium]MDD4118222.1 diadenylate cyclase CdaA [Kiritimatiellia bacterium]NCC93070.1 TIGR00159 family protein [Opitutae bacterium]HPC58404.1 diadenylate cyclase CdaA [Kiritimatiellia bacterium]
MNNAWTDFFRSAPLPAVGGLLEILVLAVVFYYIIQFLRGTRGAQVLLGFVTAVVVMLLLTRLFNLDTLNWLLQQLSVYLVIAFLIIFQPEIRRALAELGKQHVFATTLRERGVLDEIVQAVSRLAADKIGALIAIEREIGTRAVQETGTRMDSVVTAELLATIFFPHTPLHDGGVIIEGDRIRAAACVFPLSSRDIGKIGTRHRAAVGISEETDAVVVVVSEETGAISLAYKGRLIRGLDEARLRRILSSVLLRAAKQKSRWQRLGQSLDLTPEGVARTEELMEREFEEPAKNH